MSDTPIPKFRQGEVVQVAYLVGLWSVLAVHPTPGTPVVRYTLVSEDHPTMVRDRNSELRPNPDPAPQFDVPENMMRHWLGMNDHHSTVDDLERMVDSILALAPRLRDFKKYLSRFRQAATGKGG